MKSKKRVCYVVCYKDPDYIRTRVLVSALASIKGIELLVVKNRSKGILRYLEVPLKLIWARLSFRPDVFLVGFRAHEIFWAFYLAMAGKKIIFDEFINLHHWLINEHHKLKPNSWLAKLLDTYISWVFSKSAYILTDTGANAELTSKLHSVPLKKIISIPVGADEDIFHPKTTNTHKEFSVLFYGSMLPLHGVDVILEAIRILAKTEQTQKARFTLVGGGSKFKDKVEAFCREYKIDTITYISWVDFEKLPELIAESDLGLGGPFGNTGQAQRVITGKTYQFLAMAKPVVVGRIENMQGFKDRQNCLLVEQGNPKALAEAIEWAIRNKGDLPKIGIAARGFFDDNFSIRKIAGQMELTIEGTQRGKNPA